MAKKTSIEQFRNRIRSQVSQSHVEPEIIPESDAPSVPTSSIKATRATPDAKTPRRRRSKWENPYPNAEPFQTSVYLTEEDIELIKSLRLKLHLAREWMVIKYALEKLGKDLTPSNKK